ncbi:DUF4442 domain-containing protein [uncultured Polaribacter sp.]|uniref:DUF4442 domain-containing protein n=1 Tax=uncultured Polaribacter sp. TaxID=174711 RepID=UPI00260CA6B3|nr:DUF4442 domain-containing protein [uncultured Polaribacter sp.]
MKITPKKVNMFMMLKLPLAYLGGVRVKTLSDEEATVKIAHKWMNQNPFKSMFWAAQGMAAEMSTGILVMQAIEKSKEKVSMLVTHQEANFFKKATGKILFTCAGGTKIDEAIKKSKQTNKGQVIILTSEGINEDGVVVSKFSFEWSLKVKPYL